LAARFPLPPIPVFRAANGRPYVQTETAFEILCRGGHWPPAFRCHRYQFSGRPMAAPTFSNRKLRSIMLCRGGHWPPAFCLGGNKKENWAFSLPPPFGHLPHQREASTSLSSCGGFQGIRIRPLHSVQGDSIKGRDAGGEGRCGHRPLQEQGAADLKSPKAP